MEENLPEPQSIYLEGALAHDSQILVADSQTKREEVYDSELNGSPEEPAVSNQNQSYNQMFNKLSYIYNLGHTE